MSEKELASAWSYWERRSIRAGRRSRYVEVEEMSPAIVKADAIENGLVDEIIAILGTGKEADVYLGLWKGANLVLKVYRLHRTPHKKSSALGYAVDRMGGIAAKEFTVLEKAYRAGVPVPTPARRADNMFTMRYLGGQTKAPLLKDAALDNPKQIAEQAVALVEKLLDAHIVHGDLSEYNLLLWDDRLFVIDFPQAIDFSSRVTRHILIEEAKPLLLRDLTNLENYFARHSVELNAEDEYHRLTEKLEPEANDFKQELEA
jgi:RIO kinase 1